MNEEYKGSQILINGNRRKQKCEGDGQDFLFCDIDQGFLGEKERIMVEMMRSGESPLNYMVFEFGDVAKPFSGSFLIECFRFYKENPYIGYDLMSYVINGFEETNMMQIYDQICEDINSMLPRSIGLLIQLLNKCVSDSFLSRFYAHGGLVKLYEMRFKHEYLLLLSEAFLSLSRFGLSNMLNILAPNKLFFVDDIVNELEVEVQNNYTLILDLSEFLIITKDHQIICNVMNAFQMLLNNAPGFYLDIANTIVAYFHLIPDQSAIIALNVLSQSLPLINQLPEMSYIWKTIPKYIDSNSDDVIIAICAFIKDVVSHFPADFFAQLSYLKDFINLTYRLPYSVKENLVITLCHVINTCSRNVLDEIVNRSVLLLFFEFIDEPTNHTILPILKALYRFIENANDYQMIEMISEKIICSSLCDHPMDQETSCIFDSLCELLHNDLLRNHQSI